MDILRSNRLLLMCLSWLLLLLVIPPSQGKHAAGRVTFHGGPVMCGEIKLAILWYGDFGRASKAVVRNFIKSLNNEHTSKPSVASWWRVVESYQSVAKGVPRAPSPKIKVVVKKQITDISYKYGKVITIEYIPKLVQDAVCGDPSLLPVIFTGRQVSVHGLCYGKCAEHGVLGTKPYVIVGNPETECPAECAYPFLGGPMLKPPSGNAGADAMVVAFAQVLAGVVTNSQVKTGFFKGRPANPIGIAESCKGMFGKGGGRKCPGKLLIYPVNGGSYNAIGNKGRKFLLPAIWNPATKACWTV